MNNEKILKIINTIKQITSNGVIELQNGNYSKYKNTFSTVCRSLLICENDYILSNDEMKIVFDFIKLSNMYSDKLRSSNLIESLESRYLRLKGLISLKAPELLIKNEKMIITHALDEIESLI